MKRTAFSLVELSIVLVILGLLVGGILAGQSLIRASELRSVGRDFAKYETAVYAFRDKYLSLPGDMTAATNFFGAINVDAASCRTTASTGGKTCNGNGDGKIWSAAGTNFDETFHFWVQLASAGLIDGQYTGISVNGNNRDVMPGVNAPLSKFGGAAGYSAWNGSSGFPPKATGVNTITFGMAAANNIAIASVITGNEGWNLDTKMDDGAPFTGKLEAFANSGLCVTASAYVLTGGDLTCALIWLVP